MKKKLFLLFKIFAVVFLLFVGGYFIFRQQIYNYFLAKVQQKLKDKYNCELTVSSISPKGISGAELHNAVLVPYEKDTLFNISRVTVSLRFLSLLKGNVRISELEVQQGKINAVDVKDKNNFSFLLRSGSIDSSGVSERNYAQTVNRLLTLLFSSVPDHVSISEIDILYTSEEAPLHLHIPSIDFDHPTLNGTMLVVGKGVEKKWVFSGNINKRKEHFEGKLYAENSNVVIPYVDKKYKLHLAFDTLSFSLTDNEYADDHLLLKGNGLIENAELKHPKVDSNMIKVHHLASDYFIDLGKSSVMFEVPNLNLNKINFHMKIAYDKGEETTVAFDADMKRLPSQDFFNSFPEGLLSTFEGIQTSGDLAYQFHFFVNLSKPDCVKIDSKMNDYDFKIKKYGTVNFSKMNSSFQYTAYEKERAVKSFIVGPESPSFTPLDQISTYLRNAILTSEDGSFFWHNGFREDAFKLAVTDNIKKGRFARGGSTISMQLVKNVFLSRKKTIARKLEEALIVWLIEKKRLTSKERMYEVYLNVIEWGPMIYGAKEASQFYFSKLPSELTLAESIYLASIIPKPKAFKYSFDAAGNLKPFLEYFFKREAELLERKQVITAEQRDALIPNVKLTGPARNMVVKDTIPEDSLELEEEF